MEENLISMAREIERLRAEEHNPERRTRGLGELSHSLFFFLIDIVVSLARMLGYCNVLKLWKANWFEASLIFA